jgi:hypothetical protein
MLHVVDDKNVSPAKVDNLVAHEEITFTLDRDEDL